MCLVCALQGDSHVLHKEDLIFDSLNEILKQ